MNSIPIWSELLHRLENETLTREIATTSELTSELEVLEPVSLMAKETLLVWRRRTLACGSLSKDTTYNLPLPKIQLRYLGLGSYLA